MDFQPVSAKHKYDTVKHPNAAMYCSLRIRNWKCEESIVAVISKAPAITSHQWDQ